MKYINEFVLKKLRRGAEHSYRKHKNNPEATVTVRQEVAKELGLIKDLNTVPDLESDRVGLFDDEPTVRLKPVVCVKVNLQDYIKALQTHKVESLQTQNQEQPKSK